MSTNLYYVVPKKFFKDETFQQLSGNARLLFIYYWNEFLFPTMPLQVDEKGNPIITDEWEHAKLFLGLQKQAAAKARRELHKAGLVRPVLDKEGSPTKLRIIPPVPVYMPKERKEPGTAPPGSAPQQIPMPEGAPPPLPTHGHPQPYPAGAPEE